MTLALDRMETTRDAARHLPGILTQLANRQREYETLMEARPTVAEALPEWNDRMYDVTVALDTLKRDFRRAHREYKTTAATLIRGKGV